MDIETAIKTLEEAVSRANGHAFTHPMKTRDVELALRVLKRLAGPLLTRNQAQNQRLIGHRTLQRRDWVVEKFD